jgi:protocatechuate 3,4-dioxygenase beta subunit
MARSLVAVVFLLSAFSLVSAQNSSPEAKASSIAGTVIKEPGSEPLKKVLVQVVAENQKAGGNYTASTDTDGRFRIERVEPGRYRIFLERTGFIAVNGRGLKAESSILSIQSAQSIENLFFRMLPTAVISGRITDEDGDPMSEVRVIAQWKKPGKMKRDSVGTATTNDLGEYRLAGLFPGQYSVLAMPAPDFRDYEKPEKAVPSSDVPDGQPAVQSGSKPETRYLPTYFPGTFDPAQASTVELKAGDDMPVNFTLLPARTYRVHGIITGLTANQKPSVELRSKSGDTYRSNTVEVGSDGQFEVRGVAPGSYSLTARVDLEPHSLLARQDITVVAGDVDGLKLSPSPAFSLSGHLRVEGGASGNLSQYAVNLGPVQVMEESSSYVARDFFGINAAVDRSGNFEWKDVYAGNYDVQVFGGETPSAYFLKSARIGGRDIETGFTASGPATLDLVVSYKGGVIEGTVLEKEKDVDRDQPAANTTVAAVPEEKYRKIPGRVGTGTTDQNGRFLIRGLAPGDYRVYAWQDADEDVVDPDFLKSHQGGGTTVKVEENSTQRVELKIIVAREE